MTIVDFDQMYQALDRVRNIKGKAIAQTIIKGYTEGTSRTYIAG
jgi:hypothetical protein